MVLVGNGALSWFRQLDMGNVGDYGLIQIARRSESMSNSRIRTAHVRCGGDGLGI